MPRPRSRPTGTQARSKTLAAPVRRWRRGCVMVGVLDFEGRGRGEQERASSWNDVR